MVLDHRLSPDDAGGREATPRHEPPEPWGDCEVLLVAHRTHGSTHTFFHDWRFEVIMCSGFPDPGAVLFTVPLESRLVAASGWRYEMLRLEERPDPICRHRTAFSWAATATPDTPDPLAAALARARDWLVVAGWQTDPSDAAHYRRPKQMAGTAQV